VANDVTIVVLQGCRKSNYLFFYFWLCLFYKLLWSGFGELVSVMEQNPCYSIDNLYGVCESQFLETIVAELSK
jgi:hypothetical protein